MAARIREGGAARWIGAFLVPFGPEPGRPVGLPNRAVRPDRRVPRRHPGRRPAPNLRLDLALLASTLVVAGILLFGRTAVGLLMGAAISLFGLVYPVNLQTAAVFQNAAGVPGVRAFPISVSSSPAVLRD